MPGICPEESDAKFIEEMKQAVKKSLAKVLEIAKPDPDKYSGGFLSAKVVGAEGFLFEPILVGELKPEKVDRCMALSKEKAERLESHLVDNHVLSYESRNPQNGQWGGAILTAEDHRGQQFIFSFSGLPEHLDEVIVFETAYLTVGFLNRALKPAQISGSAEILEKCLQSISL